MDLLWLYQNHPKEKKENNYLEKKKDLKYT